MSKLTLKFNSFWLLLAILLAPFLLVYAQEIKFDPGHIKLAKGYKIEPLISGLSVPTTFIFDGEDMLIAESGFANTGKPRVLRIKPDGQTILLASEGLLPPVTGLLVYEGKVYVSHRTKFSVIESDGSLKDIVTDLPSLGDHQNNQIALGPDGKIYIGQGTLTNSGVVGEDNYIFGWLKKNPQSYEIPCKDITLTGQNFTTGNPLTEDKGDKATTGAYKPFGTPAKEGEVIKGNAKCGGSIARFNPDGSGFELVAWGLRNPFGLEFDKNGELWATYHGADVRGSRNIFNDPDYLVKVTQDAWYGWPEYFEGKPVTEERFTAPGHSKPQFLWKTHPPLAKAFAVFDSHSAANGIAFSKGGNFGHEGDLFIAMFGTFAPVTSGINLKPAGFRIARVDMGTGGKEDFAENTLPGPAYLNGGNGFNRPTDVAFGPDNALYVLDWGASKVTKKGLEEVPGTGAVWRIYPEAGQALRPDGPIAISQAVISEAEREALVPNIPEYYKMLSPELVIIGLVLLLIIGIIWYFVGRGRKRRY